MSHIRASAPTRKFTFLLPLIGLAVAFAATAAGADKAPRCHGERPTVRGADGDDVLKGRDIRSGDVVALGDGDDYVYLQRASHVTVCGGQGDDSISAGERAGRDLLFDGEEGRDELGSAFYEGDKVADHSLILIGGGAHDNLSGSEGPDVIKNGNGFDLALGNDGKDRIWGQGGDDDIGGGSGRDTLHGGRGDDSLYGGAFLISGAKVNPGDEADGGQGRDYCEARRERSCERREPGP